MNELLLPFVLNGTVWESRSGRRGTIQWLESDKWTLMSEEFNAAHGGKARMAYGLDLAGTFKIIVTQLELADWLLRQDWQVCRQEIP